MTNTSISCYSDRMKRVPYAQDVATGETTYILQPENEDDRTQCERIAAATPGFYAGFSELLGELPDYDEDEDEHDQRRR